jgi:hypothetical protein
VIVNFIKKSVDREDEIQPILHGFLNSLCVDGYGLGYVLGLQKITGKTYPQTYPSNSYPIEMKCILGSGFGCSQSQDHPPPTSNWGRVVLRTPEPFGKIPKIGLITGGEVREMKIIFETKTGNDAKENT